MDWIVDILVRGGINKEKARELAEKIEEERRKRIKEDIALITERMGIHESDIIQALERQGFPEDFISVIRQRS